MSAEENYAVARRLQDAFEQNDFAALDQLMTDDIVWHEIGRAEPYRGKDAMRAALMQEAANYTITAKLHDVVANDAHTLAMVEATANRNGKTFIYRTVEIYHVRNGQIVERWAFSDDTAAIVAFFS